MTPDEQRRLAVAEANILNLTRQLDAMDEKLDQLVAAANMGRGAWWLLLKLGGTLLLLVSAGAWVFDHLKVFK